MYEEGKGWKREGGGMGGIGGEDLGLGGVRRVCPVESIYFSEDRILPSPFVPATSSRRGAAPGRRGDFVAYILQPVLLGFVG